MTFKQTIVAALAFGFSALTIAAPVNISAGLDVVLYENTSTFKVIGGTRSHLAQHVEVGETKSMQPLRSVLDSTDIDVSYSVATLGNQRTLTFRWETKDDTPFFKQDTIDYVLGFEDGGVLPQGAFYGMRFDINQSGPETSGQGRVSISDDEWVSGTSVMTSYFFLDKDGNKVREGSRAQNHLDATLVLGSYTSPADPNSARGAGAATFLERTITYTVDPVAPVPVPAAAWLFGSALAGFAGLRRRKA